MVIQLIEARLYHCGQIARMVRPAQSVGALARGASPHRELAARFGASSYRRACFLDGRLAAIGGVMATEAETEGVVWAAIAEWATRYPRELLRAAGIALREVAATKRKLGAFVLIEDAPSFRFATNLGFNAKVCDYFDSDAMLWVERDLRVQQRRVRRTGVSPAPFVIYTAGRSRTAWLSEFLTYGKCICRNEIAVKFRTMDEVRRFFSNPWAGTAETGAAPGWRLVKAVCPSIRSVVIMRDEISILSSFLKLYADNGLRCDEDRLAKIVRYEQRCMLQIADAPGTLVVDFEALKGMDTCRRVFEHCLPYEFDVAWWRHVAAQDVQAPVKAIVDYYQRNIDEVEGFKRESRAFLRKMVRSGEIINAER